MYHYKLVNGDIIAAVDLPESDSEEELYEAIPLRPVGNSRCGYTQLDPQSHSDTIPLKNIYCNNYATENESQLKLMSELTDTQNGVVINHQSNTITPIAPLLLDGFSHHVVLLSHPANHAWVADLVQRLQSPALGFKCWFREYPSAKRSNGYTTISSAKVRGHLKTVIVLSAAFIRDVWCNDDSSLASEFESVASGSLLRAWGALVLLEDCEIPTVLKGLSCIDARLAGWWTRLICHLCSLDNFAENGNEQKLSISSSVLSCASTTSNGFLLHSVRSMCVRCSQELVDISECPPIFQNYGIQVPLYEYECAVKHLMSGSKFLCHVWCYNMPLSIVFFTVLLCFCLVFVPLLETQLHLLASGLQYVHGALLWLFFLTFYLIVLHISRKKMKLNTFQRLTYANTLLYKYNILIGIENLGIGDCNKYYLHFFYFNLGPCLSYIQHLLLSLSESAQLEHTSYFVNRPSTNGHAFKLLEHQGAEDEGLENNVTNNSIQTRAAWLILHKSGEYLSLLISKKLESPDRVRHMSNYPCLCQFVEQKAHRLNS